MRGMMALAVLFVWVGSLTGQVNGDFQVREDDGGRAVVRTANGVLNQHSSLRRRWLAVDNLSSPIRLNGAGLLTRFDEKEQTHFLVPIGTITPKRAISAIEVRYLLFDIWSQHLRTVALTWLADSSTNVDLRENTRWPAVEYEASQLVTTVAFAARVRTAEGQVWTFDAEKMLAQIQGLGLSAMAADLTPEDWRLTTPCSVCWTRYPAGKAAPSNSARDSHP